VAIEAASRLLTVSEVGRFSLLVAMVLLRGFFTAAVRFPHLLPLLKSHGVALASRQSFALRGHSVLRHAQPDLCLSELLLMLLQQGLAGGQNGIP